jgi:hypothetical protein
MNEEAEHKMDLVRYYPSGAEDWVCPTCGRRFLLQWTPEFRRIVLEPGDELASHSGGKGGVVMGSMQVSQDQDDFDLTDPTLLPWLDWVERVNLDSLLDAVD